MKDLKLGFGFMRLPVINQKTGQIDYNKVNTLVDNYIENGGKYFDTGFHYHNGKSEEAIRKCVTERYPRDRVLIADKMPIYGMKSTDNPEQIFNTQLKRCGIDYFDYYLVHNTSDKFYNGVCKQVDVFGYLSKAKNEGLIKHLGISHHGTPEALIQVLDENPGIEFVQLQINYLDWNSKAVQAKECYEIVKERKLDVFVMEPLKGGNLVNLPEKAEKVFKDYNNNTPVKWAMKYVLNLNAVTLVISGMNEINQVDENFSIVKEFKGLSKDELETISKVCDIINDSIEIPCTYCDYCFEYCPKQIPISKYFSIYNDEKQSNVDQMLNYLYYDNHAQKYTPASECIKCGACEEVCPQHIKITDQLEQVVELFESNN